MAITEDLVNKVKSCIGDTSPPVSGHISRLMAQRYARAIGENNPLYLDPEHARAQGYTDVIVAPNFLPSYLDFSDGGDEQDLRPDGTPTEEMRWIPLDGVRIMGGGEEMVFHRPLVAGTDVVMDSALDDVTSRPSKGSLLMILKIRNSYRTADGESIMTSIRTVLGR